MMHEQRTADQPAQVTDMTRGFLDKDRCACSSREGMQHLGPLPHALMVGLGGAHARRGRVQPRRAAAAAVAAAAALLGQLLPEEAVEEVAARLRLRRQLLPDPPGGQAQASDWLSEAQNSKKNLTARWASFRAARYPQGPIPCMHER